MAHGLQCFLTVLRQDDLEARLLEKVLKSYDDRRVIVCNKDRLSDELVRLQAQSRARSRRQ